MCTIIATEGDGAIQRNVSNHPNRLLYSAGDIVIASDLVNDKPERLGSEINNYLLYWHMYFIYLFQVKCMQMTTNNK